MKYYLYILFFLLLTGCCPASVIKTQSPNIVIFVIDGCRPDCLELASTPNIQQLMKEGATYSNSWVGGLRNISTPSHAMLGTGAFSRRNGIVCEFQKNPDNIDEMGFYNSWDEIISGNFEKRLDRRGITSIAKLYKEANPESVTVSLSASRFFAASAMGYGCDYILFNDSFKAWTMQRDKVYEVMGKGSEKLDIHIPVQKDDDDKGFLDRNQADEDEWATDLALAMINKCHPGLLMINLPATDYMGHTTNDYFGENSVMKQNIENVDSQIGRIMEEYRKLGIYDNTVWVVCSDHGMSPAFHWISEQSIRDAAKCNMTDNPEFYCDKDPKTVSESIMNAKIEGIKGAYYKNDNQYYLSDGSDISDSLDECFQYLLSTEASDFGHDVALIEKQNWRSDWYKFYPNPSIANHETISWNDQHIVMIISGKGVRCNMISSSPARIVDIAPTVLKLSEIDSSNMDGLVLADCMRNKDRLDVENQNKLNIWLSPLSLALKNESLKDLRENEIEFSREEK